MLSITRSAVILTLFVTGCSGRSYDVADPVVGPAPPRFGGVNAYAAQSDDEPDVQQVSYQEDKPLAMTDVVAMVNGRPVLAGEVLEQYAAKLEQIKPQVTDKQFREAQLMVIERDLPNIVEQALMVDAVRAKLTKEQLEKIDTQLDEFFEIEVEKMKKQFEVSSLSELEGVLQTQGMSLETMRFLFGQRQLAGEYVRGKMGEDAPVTRKELIAEYNSRLSEFEKPAMVKWQQLQVSITKQGGQTAALNKVDTAIAELRRGEEFTEVVKRHSDGPLAKNGGNWDWTQLDDIVNPDVREALGHLPLNGTSSTITSGDFLQIIKVTGRKEKSHTPFEEVQDTLREEIVQKRRKEMADTIMSELKGTAVVESPYLSSTQLLKSAESTTP